MYDGEQQECATQTQRQDQGMQDRQQMQGQDRQQMQRDPQTAGNRQMGRDEQFMKDLSEMRQETVRASDILRGDLTNGLNAVGQVKDLVLSKDASRVEYILFNTGRPYAIQPGPGYIAYEDVDLEKGSSFYGVDVRTDMQGQPRGPQELKITAEEADYRLASHITGEEILFGEGEEYEIEDILIKPDTGEITHFVIGTSPDAVFSEDRRAVPADHITVRNGRLAADLAFTDLEDMQPYAIILLW